MSEERTPEKDQTRNRISRRDFLKLGVGAAAVATGAAGVLGKLPLPSVPENNSRKAYPDRAQEPIVATVDGDQLTVMNGQASVKVKDGELAALIAEKLDGER